MLQPLLLLLASVTIVNLQNIPDAARKSRQLDLGLQDINYSSAKPPETIALADPRQSNLQPQSYLPPIEPAGAQNQPTVVKPAKTNTNPTHHGRDLCTDPFHSFLCDTTKPRKRITGARPGEATEGASSNVALQKKPFPIPSKDLEPPFNTIDEEVTASTVTTTEIPTTTERITTTYLPTTTTTTTTTRRPTTTTTTTRRPTTTTTTTRRPTTTTTTTTETNFINKAEATNNLRSYLPPDEKSPAAAAPEPAIIKPQEEEPKRDICSDPFHAFLCTPLKARKRITGSLPNHLVGQYSSLYARKVSPKPELSPAPSNEIERAYLPPSTTTTTTTRRPTTAKIIPAPSNEIERAYLPPSTTTTRRPTTTTRRPTTTERITPAPSNEVDRFYLPPSTTPRRSSTVQIYPEPSNEVKQIVPSSTTTTTTTTRRPTTTTTTTRRPTTTTTTTRRPTTAKIIPAPSNEIERAYLPPSTTRRPTTTTRRPTTTTRRPTTSVRIIPEPSNEIEREYLPPSTTRRPTTTTQKFIPQASNTERAYLPPEPAVPAAQTIDQTVVAPENHNHPHHHGRDLCTDPFHSFLCVQPKERKRITGALPSGFKLDATNVKEQTIKPAPLLKPTPFAKPTPLLEPANTFQDETRVKPGYDYPKPGRPFQQGYDYPKPERTLQLSTNNLRIIVIPQDEKVFAAASPAPQKTGYEYPKPQLSFALPSETVTVRQTQTTGYSYPKPEKNFPLPTEQKEVKIPQASQQVTGYEYPKPSSPLPLPTTQGYNYPKPEKQLTLPTEQKEVIGYSYPKPEKQLPLPTQQREVVGYQYPKPDNSLVLPTDQKGYSYPKPSQGLNSPKPRTYETSIGNNNGFSSTLSPRRLGSAEFIPVNKVDLRSLDSNNALRGTQKFGERIKRRERRPELYVYRRIVEY